MRTKFGESARAWPRIGVSAVLAAVTAGAVGVGVAPVADAASGTITGTVFVDSNVDGVFDPTAPEAGLSDVEVKAFDVDGALVGSTLSTADGTFSMPVSVAGTDLVRVEFTTPTGYRSTLVSAASGEGVSGSSVRFVTGGSTDVRYGVHVPGDYCQSNALLASVCNYGGINPIKDSERSIGTHPADISAGTPSITTIATKTEVGALWGVGWSRDTELIWSSAFIRRHSALGPEGVGGLYVHSLDGTMVDSFDLTQAPWNLVLEPAAGTFTNAARDIINDANHNTGEGLSLDLPGWSGVGKSGIGDIDVSDDGKYLWLTNLQERKVQRIAITGTAAAPGLGAVTSWSVDDGYTCANPTLRVWGLEMNSDGSVVVAGVCTNESTTPTLLTRPDGGVLLRLDPAQSGAAAWSTIATIDFTYEHVFDDCTTANVNCYWRNWSDDWNKIKLLGQSGARPNQQYFPQPMILDVETLADGSYALGISDRLSYQAGASNWAPVAPSGSGWEGSWVSGETLLICKSGATTYEQETGGACGTTYDSTRTNEYFYDEFGHPETTIGGLAVFNGKLIVGSMDPTAYFSNGLRYNDIATGDKSAEKGVQWTTEFGKSAAMGDVQVLCDAAPVQIGNRLWYDYDHDGVQDAGEPPVVGVTVHLYDDTDTLVGTAVTNAAGEYYFTSTNDEAADGGATPDEFGGGLTAGRTYTVVLDDPSDCSAGGPLEGWTVTTKDATTTEVDDQDDAIDSDAVVGTCATALATVDVAALSAGDVNHTYDIGFWVESVSVGNIVWIDENEDGVFNPTEDGLDGAVLSIENMDGTPVTDVLGRPVEPITTDASGRYLFALLPLGQYRVKITYPEGADPTQPGATDGDVDSSTDEAVSIVLDQYGMADLTLDFGVVVAPAVSVGDFVWFDTDADGVQDVGEPGLAGAVLSITTADGLPVTDLDGNPVGPVITDGSGAYLFANLPPGQYRVTVVPPVGYVGTLPGVGDGSLDSASGFAVSVVLAGGESDLTLDFGFVVGPSLPPTGSDEGLAGLALAALMVGVVLIAAARHRRRTA